MNTFFKFLTIAVLACSPVLCLAKSDSAKIAEFARENFIDKQALNVSYRLGLTDDRRMQFIKLYSEYLKQMMEMPVVSRPAGGSALSEADYERINKLEIERSRKIVELRNAYDSKFMKVISAKQLYQLHKMERSDIRRMKGFDRKQRIKANESRRKIRDAARKTAVQQRKAAAQQRKAAAQQRKAAAQQRKAAAQQRKAAAQQRKAAAQQRKATAQQRKATAQQRKAAAQQRKAAAQQRKAAAKQREAAAKQREAATKQREAATKQREAATKQREAATKQREIERECRDSEATNY